MVAFLAPLALLGNIGRGGLAAYRTMRAIRTARAAQGMPMGFQRVLGSQGAGLGKGTSGSGLQGLMARGAKKAPGSNSKLSSVSDSFSVISSAVMLKRT